MGLCFGRRDNEKDVKGGRLKDRERREREGGRQYWAASDLPIPTITPVTQP